MEKGEDFENVKTTKGDVKPNRAMFSNDMEYAGALLAQATYVVCFTGAGISVASGIPDFRSEGGLWQRFDPSIYAQYSTFLSDPKLFWELSEAITDVIDEAKPNKAHYALAELERKGKLKAIITQNIDFLHQKAGCTQNRVYELHGSYASATCVACGKRYTRAELEELLTQNIPPLCVECTEPYVKPDIILFGEPLPSDIFEEALEHVYKADLLLMIGSSLSVTPASTLPQLAKTHGASVIFINKTPTIQDHVADVILQGGAEEILPTIVIGTGEKVYLEHQKPLL